MTMRDKIARAMFDKGVQTGVWPHSTFSEQHLCWGFADAALAALLEPTEGMVDAAFASPSHLGPQGIPVRDCWCEMIRAAKGGK